MSVDLSKLRAEPSDADQQTTMFAPVSLEFSTIDADTAGDDFDEGGHGNALVDPTDEITIGEAIDEGLDVTPSGTIRRARATGARLPGRAAVRVVHRRCLPLPRSSTSRGRAGGRPHGRVRSPAGAARHRRGLTRRPVSPSDALTPSTVKLPAPGARDRSADTQPGPRSGRTRSPGATERDERAPGDLARAVGRRHLESERPAGALTAFDSRRNGHDSLPTRDRSEPALAGLLRGARQHHPVSARPRGAP